MRDTSAHDRLSNEVREFAKLTGKVCEKYDNPMVHRVKKSGDKKPLQAGNRTLGSVLRLEPETRVLDLDNRVKFIHADAVGYVADEQVALVPHGLGAA